MHVFVVTVVSLFRVFSKNQFSSFVSVQVEGGVVFVVLFYVGDLRVIIITCTDF